uniref:Uncharacterized protein n=1 Tax=Palpitomonas bilix TaxID=652834 RepID=A0A7S3FXP3_9EUKA|mmetsp:Transcript_11421/g.30259  ORF Transcript_11421/g.30259 Transcript_11421/m.30259 type:complete len:142 (+) Transcript_11421:86-511(+)
MYFSASRRGESGQGKSAYLFKCPCLGISLVPDSLCRTSCRVTVKKREKCGRDRRRKTTDTAVVCNAQKEETEGYKGRKTKSEKRGTHPNHSFIFFCWTHLSRAFLGLGLHLQLPSSYRHENSLLFASLMVVCIFAIIPLMH